MLSLKTMTESKLKVLKREVEVALQAKVVARRLEIESELSRLSLLGGGGRPKVVKAAAKGMGAAKYRKPASASKAAGRKLDESLNAGSPKVSSAKQPKKTRRAKKMRNVENITSAALLTSVKIEHTEPPCIDPLDRPVPIEALSATSVHPNNIPIELGGGTAALGAA
jgi:hypothetical protein